MSKLTKPCATSWLSSLASPTTVVVDGYKFEQTRDGIQSAINSCTDASAAKPYTVLLYPGVYDVTTADTSLTSLDLRGTSTTLDYIRLVGLDRKSTIIKRTTAAATTTGIVNTNDHCFIGNLTFDCGVTRHVHWDRGGTGLVTLDLDSIDFIGHISTLLNVVSTGIQAGVDGDSRMRVVNSHFQNCAIAAHGNTYAGGSETYIFITGNTFTASGTVIAIDFTTNGSAPYHVIISGNVNKRYYVDPEGGIGYIQPSDSSAAQKVMIWVDGALRSNPSTGARTNYFYPAFVYPTQYPYLCSAVFHSGDIVAYFTGDGALNSTSGIGVPFPIGIANYHVTASDANQYPNLANGLFAACYVASATQVAVGDTLVTTATHLTAGVDNTVTDLRQIFGWAMETKAAGSRSLVFCKRNTSLMW